MEELKSDEEARAREQSSLNERKQILNQNLKKIT